ncbi:hypothetical protein VTG60DRAFT_4845 [Thermothelomyces hinnuleus]
MSLLPFRVFLPHCTTPIWRISSICCNANHLQGTFHDVIKKGVEVEGTGYEKPFRIDIAWSGHCCVASNGHMYEFTSGPMLQDSTRREQLLSSTNLATVLQRLVVGGVIGNSIGCQSYNYRLSRFFQSSSVRPFCTESDVRTRAVALEGVK